MALVIKPSGSIAYTEITASVIGGGGTSSTSFNNLNTQAYTLTNSSVYLPPDKFSEFVGTSGNVFTFADWTGVVSISEDGVVSFTNGNVTTISISPTSFGLVGTPTSRSVSVTITVPSGFSNTGVLLTGTRTAIQPAKIFTFAIWTGTVSVNEDGIVSFTLGNAAAVSVGQSTYPVVLEIKERVISVTLTAPSGYFNAGVVGGANLTGTKTVNQPPKLFTYAMWTGVLSVNCEGVISATTGNGATPITFNPISYPEMDIATERYPTITVTVPSGYGNSGQTVSTPAGNTTKSATQPAKFLTTTWSGTILINKNTGVVSVPSTNATVNSITPTSFGLTTSTVTQSVTLNVQIPSGYCNSGTLNVTRNVQQLAADETINILLNGSHNTWNPSGQGDAALLQVFTIAVWNTAWTVELTPNNSWLTIEEGISTGTGNGTKTIAAGPNYTAAIGFNGSTRNGLVKVYKTSNPSIFDQIGVTQSVGVRPVAAPTFTINGGTTFAWNESGIGYTRNITVLLTGGSNITSGYFFMETNDFNFYNVDGKSTINNALTNERRADIDSNFLAGPGTQYVIGIYPNSNNNSTTSTRTVNVYFICSNIGNGTGGSADGYVEVNQSVSPPTFTIGNANVTGFAVAQNGSITPPQSQFGTITNRVYSSGGNYGRVCFDTERYVDVTVQVPAGYSNSGVTVGDRFFTNQPSSPTFSFGTWNGSVSVSQNGNIFVSSIGNAASVQINTGDFGPTYGGDVSRTINITVTAPGGYCNEGATFTNDTTATQQGTPIPTLSINVNVGCSGYAGSGYIEITSVSGGSGNYTYHIESTVGSSFNESNPNTYNLNSSQYGLSNGNYNVAVYDNFYNIYAYQIRNINCAQPPPTFTFGDWNGVVEVDINGIVGITGNNASVVSFSPTSYPVIYGTGQTRTINVTITVPGGYANSGNQLNGYRDAFQPAVQIYDPTVTVYTLCNSYITYFIEGSYTYPTIEINGDCYYLQYQSTRSVVQGYYTEFFGIYPSSCSC